MKRRKHSDEFNIPFIKPAAKDYLWGGSRLNDDFNLNIDITPFAEAWVCSTHPDGVSKLASGDSLAAEIPSAEEHLHGQIGTPSRRNRNTMTE